MIADAAGAIALAGVIGGGDSAISEKTTRVVLESANFQASSIRKTSSAIKLRTDATMRFEKAQDPANTVRGLARAIELLQEISPGIRLVGGVADQMREMPPPPAIELPLPWLQRKLGRAIAAAEVRRILESLAFGVTRAGAWACSSVTVPELARHQGRLDQGRSGGRGRAAWSATIPSRRRRRWCPPSVPPGNPARRFQHDVRNLFVDNGFTEVYNYSFLSEESVRAFGFDPAAHIRVTNPIASDQELMRASLLPGIWRNVTENAKHRESFRLFEIGLEIHRRAGGPAGGDSAPGGGALRPAGRWPAGLFELKRMAECLHAGRADRARRKRASYEHPARAAEIQWKGAVGRLFELHPRLVETGRAAILDLDLRSGGVAQRRRDEVHTDPPLSVERLRSLGDCSRCASTPASCEAAIAGFAGPLLESIQFVRQYAGPPLAEGTKSVSFRLTVGSPERTLSSDEIAAIRTTIIEGMRELGYELRV